MGPSAGTARDNTPVPVAGDDDDSGLAGDSREQRHAERVMLGEFELPAEVKAAVLAAQQRLR